MAVPDFSEWLREELQKRGWRAATLARESGISRGAISHIFNHERTPGIDMLRAIAKAFDLPLITVLQAAGMADATPPQEELGFNEWMRLFKEADEETRARLLALAKASLRS